MANSTQMGVPTTIEKNGLEACRGEPVGIPSMSKLVENLGKAVLPREKDLWS